MFAQWYDLGPEWQDREIAVPVEPGEFGSVVVYAEVLSGDPAEVSISPTVATTEGATVFGGAAAMAQAQPLPRRELAAEWASAFAGALSADADEIRVAIQKPPEARVRVFIAWVRDTVLPPDGCGRCVAVVKAALRIARAFSGGIVGPEDIVDALALADLAMPEWLSDFLDRFFGENAWDNIRDALRRIGRMLNVIAVIAEAVCQRMGYCADNA